MADSYTGVATMYLAMPMSAQNIPVLGSCVVEDRKVQLKFPISGVSFDLPETPKEGTGELEFKMAGSQQSEMLLKIKWNAGLKAFLGSCSQNGKPQFNFIFSRPDSSIQLIKDHL
ncbi:DgyrCDS6983 [Dimorphilus gyrociliatus]|uniref:DgyrCDS6983 n=1 Tax=Dimorphilus gyrociliatus TaxID=2664684 RepID=A0A7I8VPV5_9ANNE|nr:DgyrCDS6983 [Dimorphilus gyrociliatus]